MSHPLAVTFGDGVYTTLRNRVQARPYNLNTLWEQVQRVLAVPASTIAMAQTLADTFSHLDTLQRLTDAFDLAVALAPAWPAAEIVQARANRPAPLTVPQWTALCAALTGAQATNANAQQFAAVANWASAAEKAALAAAFNANQGGLTAAQWRNVAEQLLLLNATGANAAAFCQLPNAHWNVGQKRLAAQAFNANQRGLTAPQYAAVAAPLTGGRAQADTADRFAAMAQYAAGERAALAASFEADQCNLTVQQWLDIASQLNGANATAANAQAFARLPHAGWTRVERRTLAANYDNNQHGMTGAQWAAVAGVLGGDRRTAAVATPLMSVAGFTADERRALATAFEANRRGMTSAQWAAIGNALTGGRRTAATASAIAALEGWAHGERAALAAAYDANQRGLTLVQWTTLAGSLTGVRATSANAVAFAALAGWAADQKLAIAAAFEANQYGATAAEWAAVATELAAGNRTSANAVRFVNLPGWTPANRRLLAIDYAANQRNRNITQWTDVARELTDARASVANVREFLNIANWAAADEAELAHEFEAHQYNRTAAQWRAETALHAGQNRPGLRTARWIAYRHVNWPATLALGGVQYRLKAVASQEPGLVYEPANGDEFPHITIHNLAINRSPGQWRLQGRDYQVVLDPGGPGNTYPHDAANYAPFPNNPGVVDPAATALAALFWATV